MALVQSDTARNGEDAEFLAFLGEAPDSQFDAFVRELMATAAAEGAALPEALPAE